MATQSGIAPTDSNILKGTSNSSKESQRPDPEFKIEVLMTPQPWDNPTEPYFWCILTCEKRWSNVGSGWAISPDQAFKDAQEYFNKHITKNKGKVF